MAQSTSPEQVGRRSSKASPGPGPASNPRATKRQVQDHPMGMLSGVRADGRLFQLQTEFTTQPEELIVTSVIRDGQVLQTNQTRPPASSSKAHLAWLIGQQHRRVEGRLRAKLRATVRAKGEAAASAQPAPKPQPTPEPAETAPVQPGASEAKDQFQRLFRQGWEHYRDDDLQAALSQWEKAKALDPDNPVLHNALSVLRARLGG